VDQTAQKSPRRQNHRTAADPASIRQHHACDRALVNVQVIDLALNDRQVRCFKDRLLHCRRIELSIGLRPRASHRRSLASVEHPELNAAKIGDAAHQSVERINLAHQMTLAQTANRGVATHCADRRGRMRDKCRRRAQARCGGRRFGPGVAAADNNDIIGNHELLPVQAGSTLSAVS
jgi:hypothetical protein